MILTLIFHIFKVIFTHAIKAIAWLLVSLSLWVPLVYTLFFVVICGLSGTSLSEVKSWYLGGLALPFIGSFAVSTYLYERRLKRKKQQKKAGNLEKVKEKTEALALKKRDEGEQKVMDEPVLGEPVLDGANPSQLAGAVNLRDSDLAQADLREAGQKSPSQTADKHDFYAYDALNPQSNGIGLQENTGDKSWGSSDFTRLNADNFGGYDTPYGGQEDSKKQQDSDGYKSIFDSPVLDKSDFSQPPKIFATRSDPTVFIYEYADRLEYCKRTRAGMVLLSTKQKN